MSFFVRMAVLVALIALTSSAGAQSFPADASWTVLEQQGVPLQDSSTDGNGGGREIVGDTTSPAVYLASDGAYFYVRMRLDTDPTQNGSLRQFGWSLLIDTDNDFANYEYMIMLDGIAETIVLAENTVKTNLGDPSDLADVDRFSAPIVMGTNVIVGPADFPAPASTFNGDADTFLDFALPWSALTAVGLTPTQPVRFLAGTSNNGRSVTVELAGTSASPGAGTLMLGSSDQYPLGLVPVIDTDGAVLIDAGVTEDAASPDAPTVDTSDATTGNGFTVRGGGCSTTGSGGLGTLVLVLGALLGALRRRRALVAGLVIVTPAAARAQVSTEFQLERFRLSTDRGGLFDVEWAELLAPRSWSVGLSLGWADDELVVEDDSGNRSGALVAHRLGADLVGAVALTRWLQVGIDIPLIVNQSSDEPMQVSVGSIDSFALGDLRVAPKLGLLRQSQHGISLALIPGFSLPTATTKDYAGESGMTFAPELAVSRRLGAVRIGGNLGMRIRDDQRLADLDVDNEAFLRLGAGYRVDDLELGLTTSVATATNNLFDRTNQRHWELLGGAQYDVRESVVAFGAVGLGLEQGFGTPDWRALLGLRFDMAPAPPGPTPITVRDDRVVSLPPLPQDTDGDGLVDHEDACPAEAEDRDGFQDTDGCPDPDNDRDGVIDLADRCPLEAGVASAAGCAEPDRDGDSVIDRQDNCPDEPGEPKHAGCKSPQQVTLTGGKLEILDIVYFQTSKAVILSKSYSLLDNVAAVLSAHPEITKLRVEGHTDDRGDDGTNLDLSRRRAEAVVAYLVSKGVAKDRLESEGLGETRPIAPNDSNDNRARNRRVEFVIVAH